MRPLPTSFRHAAHDVALTPLKWLPQASFPRYLLDSEHGSFRVLDFGGRRWHRGGTGRGKRGKFRPWGGHRRNAALEGAATLVFPIIQPSYPAR